MSESKRAQIVEQSIVLLDRVLSNSPAKASSITNVLAGNFAAYPFVSAWMNLSGFVSNATL
jgi:hypothetical protein